MCLASESNDNIYFYEIGFNLHIRYVSRHAERMRARYRLEHVEAANVRAKILHQNIAEPLAVRLFSRVDYGPRKRSREAADKQPIRVAFGRVHSGNEAPRRLGSFLGQCAAACKPTPHIDR